MFKKNQVSKTSSNQLATFIWSPIFFMLLLITVYLFFPSFILRYHLSAILILVAFMFLKFLNNLSKRLMMLEILTVFTCISWLLSPALSYYLREINWYVGYYFMPIDSAKYFEVALPGALLLFLGIYTGIDSVKIDYQSVFKSIDSYFMKNGNSWRILFFLGLVSILFTPYIPTVLRQITHLGRNLIYMSMLYVIFSQRNSASGYVVTFIVLAITLVLSIYAGMFGDFIFWTIFFYIILSIRYKIPTYIGYVLCIFGIAFIVLIQAVKGDYRKATWYANTKDLSKSSIEIFTDLTSKFISNKSLLIEPVTLSRTLDRTNQGYLTAYAIQHTPSVEPYANGETIFLAIASSLIPRFLWPDKPKAGGAENIARFTSLVRVNNTSFNIAPLGDAYVNFGPLGGAIFLFFYGFLFRKLYNFLLLKSLVRPRIVLWIPFVFSAFVVGETDVVTTFNHTTKAIVFMVFILFLEEKLFKKT